MTFDSFVFAVFLPIVLGGYYVLRRRAQNVFLLAASYVFYGWWDARFLILLAATTLVDYACGLGMQSAGDRRRRVLLWISILSNLGVLGFFKYFQFFSDSASRLASALGYELSPITLSIVLPVGISFYTFQSMAYTIDVYRRQIPACRNPITFALYVAYFPQLVAGPIERASHLIPQLSRRRAVTRLDLQDGGWLILLGLFKKVGVSNALGPLVDAVFNNPHAADGPSLLLGIYGFAAQIYCDFSGYSDIARGVSRWLGIDLMQNFAQPYFATSFREFWRRWHISLSQWLRDYLYIPLGGNRGGRWRTYRNLMLTMTLGGLWHGAAWHFVAWGMWHGVWLSLERALRRPPWFARLPVFVRTSAAWLLVFHAIVFSWLLFRCPSLADVQVFLRGIWFWQSGERWINHFELARCVGLIATVVLIDIAQVIRKSEFAVLDWSWPWRGLAMGSLVIVLLVLGGLNVRAPFIYFQF